MRHVQLKGGQVINWSGVRLPRPALYRTYAPGVFFDHEVIVLKETPHRFIISVARETVIEQDRVLHPGETHAVVKRSINFTGVGST